MRLGATLVHLSDAPPYAVAPWAQRLAAAGFESLWTPHVIGRGALVPDPFVTLAVAAAAVGGGAGSAGIELGTATVQVPLHHPADLAHRVLSLMTQCGGRFTLGVSPGSTGTDYATLGRDFATRFTTFDRHIERLRVLLATGQDADAVICPAPTAAGGPKLLLGSWGVNVAKAAERFDGWLASGYRRSTADNIAALARFRAAGGQRAIVCAIPVGPDTDLAATAAALGSYAEAGFDDAVVLIGPSGPDPAEVRALLPLDP